MNTHVINFVSWLNSNPNNVRVITVAVTLALALAAGAGVETALAGSAPGGTDAN
jgi:hypothetical protein